MAKYRSIKLIPKTDFKPSVFERHVLDSLARQINVRVQRHKVALRAFVRDLTYDLIMNCPEANELRNGGKLAAELGLVAGSENEFVDTIAREVAKNLRVPISKARRKGRGIGGGIKIGIIKTDYSDVFSLDIAEYVTVKADILPQLRWLITEGDRIIIDGYGVRFKKGAGRSGGAFMQRLSDKVVRPFRIDPNYSGTEDDNWLTRAFTDNKLFFIKQIAGFLRKMLS